MRVVGYVRVSTQEQAQEGVSLDAQEAAIRSWSEANGASETVIYRDEGLSGSRPDRPGLMAAMDSLRKGDVLVVAKLDRLARETFLALWIEKEVKKAKAQIVSLAGEGADGDDDPMKTLMRQISMAFAEYELAMIRLRTLKALAHKKARHEKTGGDVPYGFTNEAGKLHPHAEEQAGISLIHELRNEGHSLRGICRKLKDAGIPRRDGLLTWNHQVVSDILKRVQATA